MSRSERLEKLIRISNSLNSSQPQNDQIKKDCNFKKISSFKSIANFKISTDQQIITSLNLIELIYQLNQSIQSNLNQDELAEILNDSQTKFLSSNFSAIHQDSLKISVKFLSKFVSIQNLIFNLKNILVSILIKILNLINLELNIIFKDFNDQDQPNQNVMIFGSKDLNIIKKLGQTISIYGIYQNFSSNQNQHYRHSINFDPKFQDRIEDLRQEEEEDYSLLLNLNLHQIIKALTQIILPFDLIQLIKIFKNQSNKKLKSIIISNPKFTLHLSLFSTLYLPILTGLIKIKSLNQSSDAFDNYLNQLLDLADSKTVFSSLLSLASSPFSFQNQKPNQFHHQICQILSARLLRSSGLSGLFQSIMSDDYHEDDLDPQMPSNHHQLQTTSATLNRLSSLYHLLSHPPSHLSTQSYWIPISKSLIEIILPTFFNLDQPHDRIAKPDPFKLAPDPLRRAACYVLGQTIVHQLDVYKSFISPIIHLAFRPSCSSDEPVDSIIISSSQILYTVQLLNQLILNSDPSHTLVDRLILPILPQLLSLTVFLFKTKADPFLRQQIESLLDIWIKFNDAEIVAELLKKSVREIELGRELNIKHFQDKTQIDWSRDDEGMACIKLKNKREEESIEIRPDLDGLAKWLQAQKSQAFIGTLLVKWFNELELLRNRTGFLEAKMTLIRMQLILKIIEVFDSSTIHDPVQMLNFIKHTFSSLKDDAHFNRNRDSDDLNSSAPFEAHSSTLHSLKILGVTKVKTQEEDDDMSQGILLTGLSLLSAVVEANPDMNEQNTPPLKEITVDIDHLLTNSSALNPELQELGIRCRLMLSVRKALAEVPHHTDKVDSELEEEKNQLTKKYSEGLKLVEDECLPLRSQGIVMLKEVLLAQPKSTEAKKLIEAWTKGVIEIFLRMIEEEDSFVYLNAIKGLSGIAERWSHLVCD